MDESPRITELRKKLEKDPGSRLFAQLAEELRKAGQLDEAIVEARTGLEKHPNYPSARLTLARALLDSGRPEDASPELFEIVKAAPDNILASRLLADAFDALGQPEQAVLQYERTLRLSPDDKALLAKIDELKERLDAAPTLDLRAPAVEAPAAPPLEPSPPPKVLPRPAALSNVGEAPTPAIAPPPLDRDLASGTLTGSMNVADLAGIVVPDTPSIPEADPTPRARGLQETIGTGDLPAIEVPEEDPAIMETLPGFHARSPAAAAAPAEIIETPAGVDMGPSDVAVDDPEPPTQASEREDAEAEASSDSMLPIPEPEPLEHGPDDVGARTIPLTSLTLADLYLQQGLKAEATAVLSQVLEAEPENKVARQKLSEVSQAGPAEAVPEVAPPAVSTPRTPATKRADTIASLGAFLAAVEREAVEQRASERGAV